MCLKLVVHTITTLLGACGAVRVMKEDEDCLVSVGWMTLCVVFIRKRLHFIKPIMFFQLNPVSAESTFNDFYRF